MDHAVKHLRNCEHTAYDCAQVDQELENVLPLVGVKHRHLLDRVVENYNLLSRVHYGFL